jgi:hypothetical protein
LTRPASHPPWRSEEQPAAVADPCSMSSDRPSQFDPGRQGALSIAHPETTSRLYLF